MRFYEIKSGFSVNAGLIKYIESIGDSKYKITMIDDNIYIISDYMYKELLGSNELKCITAVDGFVAHFETEEDGEYTQPVYCFGVFEDGGVKPLDLGVDTTEPMNIQLGFEGVSKDGEELVHG